MLSGCTAAGAANPARDSAFCSMLMPMTATSAVQAMRIGPAKRRFNVPLIRPTPSISGTVPRLKQNMESAPIYQLPVERAKSCMA